MEKEKEFDNQFKVLLEESVEVDETVMDRNWAKMDRMLDGLIEPVEPIRPETKKFNYLRWAAIIAIPLVAAITLFSYSESYETKFGESKVINLPDGSLVTLNADSRLSYNPLLWSFNRSLNLSGEAFFEVETGEVFEVNSPSGKVKVLGTSFDVFDRNERFVVSCLTGKVSVSNGTEVILTPGKYSRNKGNTLEILTYKNTPSFKWQEGLFEFEDVPLIEVIREFERQYDVEVELPTNHYNDTYNGFFMKGDIRQALKLICAPLGLNYEIEGKRIVINE